MAALEEAGNLGEKDGSQIEKTSSRLQGAGFACPRNRDMEQARWSVRELETHQECGDSHNNGTLFEGSDMRGMWKIQLCSCQNPQLRKDSASYLSAVSRREIFCFPPFVVELLPGSSLGAILTTEAEHEQEEEEMTEMHRGCTFSGYYWESQSFLSLACTLTGMMVFIYRPIDSKLFNEDGGIHYISIPEKKGSKLSSPKENRNKMAYCVTDVPPWYLCILLGIQHYLTALGGIVAIPLLLSRELCLQHDHITQSLLISTMFFVSGICTLLQVLLGVRLPILQGGTFAFLTPTVAMLSLPKYKCPEWIYNKTLVNASDPIFIEVWQTRLREIQGAIMVAACFQIFVGFSGLIGFLLRFIGPLTIAPTISLIGLSLFDSAGNNAGAHWGISGMTAGLIILFSQYLRSVPVPFPAFSRSKKCHIYWMNIFQIFPVLLGIVVSWVITFLLTHFNIFPDDPDAYGYLARTDIKSDVIMRVDWFRIPYPGQWGLPTVSLAGIFGILAGVISSMIESVGDYHACARLCGAPSPPKEAINRGIGIEGIGCLLAGAWGTGNGTTSYSENVGALGITKVGSRTVILTSGFLMILIGMFVKIGAIFSTIPEPVIGGMLLVMFGVITAVGISNLQFVDMNSTRNIFIFGFSMFAGMVIPNWMNKHPHAIQTGALPLDQVIRVLLTTSMFVGGFFGFFLDNTIPGTEKERGIITWKEANLEEGNKGANDTDCYNLPFGIGTKCCTGAWRRYIPFCPKSKPPAEERVEVNTEEIHKETQF
ncbi:xan_ur_permease domain-containing protein [Heptranchias perlo]|uniref:xan_ur_permease domain-containing protein n=1 Tax=Heptranchias perlo TaxID=212740 RepID=UPI003559E523